MVASQFAAFMMYNDVVVHTKSNSGLHPSVGWWFDAAHHHDVGCYVDQFFKS